jgi:ribonuclease Z
MAVVEEHTWSPPLASPAIPPDMADRDVFSQRTNWEVGYSDFIISGKWDGIEEELREIYREASEAMGREFPYPESE